MYSGGSNFQMHRKGKIMKRKGLSEYRGFKIETERLSKNEGCTMFSYRISDDWVLVDEWNPSVTTIEQAIEECKITIDDYYENPDWYED